MDFLPSSMSLWSDGGAPTFWPALTNALLYLLNARPVRARVLVSKWAWTDPTMVPYLRALLATSRACRQGQQAQCRGALEVREFVVPGWNDTLSAARAYPGHSRVNHNKVSELTVDCRLHSLHEVQCSRSRAPAACCAMLRCCCTSRPP